MTKNREAEIEAELLNLADRNPDWALAYVILRVAKALEELTDVMAEATKADKSREEK
jgi:hypothetical protein